MYLAITQHFFTTIQPNCHSYPKRNQVFPHILVIIPTNQENNSLL
ncbi:hypothetical protein B6N60_01885 [Richelia sinica FACHB-800]|uniref:Uncharacterized protein n=1 Tax=Richelia sinica FACHB-800 TaxID=1357546 RepID=A0A975T6L9_9NOST|nr:hypothetical protein B6N60_01885 [Richelia sinica FACHB-800]